MFDYFFAFFLIIVFVLILFVFLLYKLFSFIFCKFDAIGDKNHVVHTRGGYSYMNSQCNFGENGNIIDINNINYFREIPSNDIFRVYWLVYNYGLGKNDEDILLSLFLKWINDDNIKLVDEKVDGNKIVTNVIFNNDPCGSTVELNLYNYMKSASIGNNIDGKIDNKLTKEEFKEWCINNYNTILGWFSGILDYEVSELIKEGKIIVRKGKPKSSSKSKYQLIYDVDNSMMEEAIKLAGLKKYLEEFSLIDSKEPIEVKLWDNYLVYAAMFGIAAEVSKKLKDYNSDFEKYVDNIFYISSIMKDGIKDAKLIQSSYKYLFNSGFFKGSLLKNGDPLINSILSGAIKYSAGGGGFSSGGGGGGSFGGGGGGGGFR